MSPVTGTETSCLDHIWHHLCSTCSSGVMRPALSHHYPVYCAFDVDIKTNPIKINFLDFSIANIGQFENDVEEVFRACISLTRDANMCTLYINDFLCKLLNKYFPVKTKVIWEKRLNSPWLAMIL